MPFDSMLVGKCFEPLQIFFAETLGCFLVGRIAKKNAATKRPGLSRRAEIVFLKWAEVGRDGLLVSRGLRKKDIGFQVAHKKRVPVFLESAAATASQADRSSLSYRSIHLAVEFQDLALEFGFHGLFRPEYQRRMTFIRRVISSAGMSSPLPDPGQTLHVSCQASGVSTLLSQKGQVRHCLGRTG